MMDKLDGLSLNIEQTERDKLCAVFPHASLRENLI